ncbi:MAG: SRPBCC family protein [Myxococcota bacterium]
MEVTTWAEVDVSRPPGEVFDLATANETLPRVFHGRGPIPGIRAARVQDGGALREGCVRQVTNSDGSVVEERIVALRRPVTQQYELLSGFKPPFSWMVRSGGGRWTFTETPGGTHIRWEFHFVLTSPVFWPVARAVLSGPFRGAMQDCLHRIRDLATSGGSA